MINSFEVSCAWNWILKWIWIVDYQGLVIFDHKCLFLQICDGFRSACINIEVNLSLRKFPELLSFSLLICTLFCWTRKPELTIFCGVMFLFFISKKIADLNWGLCGFCLNFTAPVFIYFFGFHRLNIASFSFHGPEFISLFDWCSCTFFWRFLVVYISYLFGWSNMMEVDTRHILQDVSGEYVILRIYC